METSLQKRILMVGMPDMALICLTKLVAEGINIVACVPPHKSHNTYKLFTDYVKKLEIPIIDYENTLKDEDFLKKLKDLEIDLAIVCSYDRLFPKEFIEVAKDGFVNVHPSLLPEYRGANTYSHVIINDEKETGVTLHFMDSNYDTGDIIYQQKVQVFDNDTMGTIFNRLTFLGADMLYEMLLKYETGVPLPRRKQPVGNFKKAPAIRENTGDAFINWSKSAKEIERFIRALNPYIGALTVYRGNMLKIHSSYVEDYDSGFEPGTIISTDGDLAVAAKRGTIHITILQAGSYFIGQAADFIRLSHCKAGEMIGR